MIDWISYIGENIEDDIWGFIFLDYYYSSSFKKHAENIENYEPERFINENINPLSKNIKDLVHFHKVYLKICVQLLFDSKQGVEASTIRVFNKSFVYLTKHKKNLSEKQIDEIINQFGNSHDENSFRKKDEFVKYLTDKDFFKVSSKIPKITERKHLHRKSKVNVDTLTSTKMKEHKLPNKEIENKQLLKRNRKAIFVTAIEEEFQILNSSFAIPTIEDQHPDTGKSYRIGQYETASNIWEIMLVETGKTNDEAQSETTLLLQYFKPEIALFIGTAGRLDRKLGIGDIIIPPVVVGYNYGKAKKDITSISLSNIRHPSSILIESAKAVKRDTLFMKDLCEDKGKFPKAKFNIIIDEDKPVASGNMTVKDLNSKTAQLIREKFPEAIAVDMEGIGFFKACKKFPKVEYLLIRGIADYLSNKAAANKAGSRELAMQKAAKIA